MCAVVQQSCCGVNEETVAKKVLGIANPRFHLWEVRPYLGAEADLSCPPRVNSLQDKGVAHHFEGCPRDAQVQRVSHRRHPHQ